nr:MAG TPA: hypothetical protein [Caudoviricetes sp.]
MWNAKKEKSLASGIKTYHIGRSPERVPLP